MSIRVIADNKIPFLEGALEPFLDIEYMPGNEITHDKLNGVDALLIRTRTRCDKNLLEGTSVKFIATATIGFDHIDVDYCKHAGIAWTNAPGCNAGSVLQYISAVILHYAKNHNIDLRDRVLGVVGVGNVGSKVVKLGEALGMRIIMNDPPRARNEGSCGFMSLDGILREADIISLHVPLNMAGKDKTYHLVDETFLAQLNPGTLLINSSRGEVVDTKAILHSLKEGKPEALILDVWENEPNIVSDLLKLSYIGTPHIAGYSADGKANGTMMSVQALSKFFDLGIDNWEPDYLPEPPQPKIEFAGNPDNIQEILTHAVLETYNIEKDNSWLREDINKFEYYRGNYPIRREFNAYTISGDRMSEEMKRRIRRLGFNIK